jgi:hypothetical protein
MDHRTEDRFLERMGELTASVDNMREAITELRADIKSHNNELHALKERVAVHAGVFGFIGSLLTVSATSLIKKLTGVGG